MFLDIQNKNPLSPHAGTINQLLHSARNRPDVLLEMGNDFFQYHNLYAAVTCYQLAIELHLQSNKASNELIKEAKKRILEIHAHPDLNGDISLKIANLFFTAEIPEKALLWYERAVEKGKTEEGNAGIGDCYKKQGKNYAAIVYYTAAYNLHIRYAAKLMLIASAPGITTNEIILIGNTLFNKQDYQNALSVFRNLLAKNIPHIYYYVVISKYDSAQKIYELEKEMANNNPDAADEIEKIYQKNLQACERITIGDMYLRGEHVPRSYTKAKQWYTSAQKMNYIVADERLGRLYEEIYGNNSNPKFAYETYYKLAFRPLDIKFTRDDTFMAATMYEEGQYIVRDIHRAITLYNNSANRGSVSAVNKLIHLYLLGYEPDERETKIKIFISNRYDRNAIVFPTKNKLEPNIFLGTDYCLDISDDKTRKQKINELLDMGEKELISPSDLCNIAFRLYSEKLFPEALSFYELAAKKGSALAIGNLGLLYLQSEKTSNNRQLAAQQFQDAISKGEPGFKEQLDGMTTITEPQNTPAVAPTASNYIVLSADDTIDPSKILDILERLTLLERMAEEKGLTLKELGKFLMESLSSNNVHIAPSYSTANYEIFLNIVLSYYLAIIKSSSENEKSNIYRLMSAKGYYNLAYINQNECIDIGLIFYCLGEYEEAVSWLQNANSFSKKGRANYFLGYLYEQGMGIPKNMTLALKHYELSAEEGYPLSVAHVDRLQKEIEPSQPATLNSAASPS